MLISIVTDGSELSNYSAGKTLNSASKNWDVEVLIFIVAAGAGKELETAKKRFLEKGVELDVAVSVEVVEADGDAAVAERICEKAERAGATGIFVPENLSGLLKELEARCSEIPVEAVSSDIFPTLSELMTKRIATIDVKATLNEAARLMVKKRIGSVIVTEKNRVVGILTEHDFVRSYADGDGKRKTVREAMSHPVISLDRSATIFEACELMKKHRIKKLVIMEDGELQGIITTTDLARLPLGISESLNYLVSNIKKLSF